MFIIPKHTREETCEFEVPPGGQKTPPGVTTTRCERVEERQAG